MERRFVCGRREVRFLNILEQDVYNQKREIQERRLLWIKNRSYCLY
jgi:hypothetical protein